MRAVEALIAEFARLPGIGRKTAQRLTFHLLQHGPDESARLARALDQVAASVQSCRECGYVAEEERCEYCRDPRRDAGLLCVVEDAASVVAVERSTEFRGRYHVLGGRLSPLDGVGPDALRISGLLERVRGGGVREVILATNPSMEGEVTATHLQQLLAGEGVRVTRLARGLPMGGDLEYVDGVTLAHALLARQDVSR